MSASALAAEVTQISTALKAAWASDPNMVSGFPHFLISILLTVWESPFPELLLSTSYDLSPKLYSMLGMTQHLIVLSLIQLSEPTRRS